MDIAIYNAANGRDRDNATYEKRIQNDAIYTLQAVNTVDDHSCYRAGNCSGGDWTETNLANRCNQQRNNIQQIHLVFLQHHPETAPFL
jgi:hypothetical protein